MIFANRKSKQRNLHAAGRLTKTDKDLLLLFVLLQLVLLVNGTVIKIFGILHNLWCSKLHPIVKVSKEEQVVKLVGQVKLAKTSVLQRSHALQNVIVVLIASG